MIQQRLKSETPLIRAGLLLMGFSKPNLTYYQ